MRRRRRDPALREDLDRWLLTYADLITLLLALFVVMYSMSQVDAKKFGKVKQALNTVLLGPYLYLPVLPCQNRLLTYPGKIREAPGDQEATV